MEIEGLLSTHDNPAPKYWKIKFTCDARVRRSGRKVACANTLAVAVPLAAMHSQAGYHIICPACGQTYAITEQGAVKTEPNKGIDAEGNPLK